MNAVRKIARNTISLSIAELIGKLGHFLIFVYIARAMGSLIFGTFNFAYALSLIAVVFTDIGINFMIIREASKNRSKISSYIGNSFLIKIAFSIITYSIVILIMELVNYPASTKAIVYLIFTYIVIRSLSELLFSVFKAFESMHYEAAIKIATTFALVGITAYAIMQKSGLIAIGFVYVIVQAVSFIITFLIVMKKFAKISFKFDIGISKEIIKKAFPFAFSLIFAGIYFYIGSVMLSLIKGDAEVGIYSAAYNITLAVLIVPGMYTFAIYPILSRKFSAKKSSKSNETVKLIYQRSFKYLYMIGLPISVGMFILARQIIVFVYGDKYYGSAIALQILAWFVFLKFLSYLSGIVLSSIDRQYLRMYSQGISAFVNLGANLMLIPIYGLVGAAIATLLSEFILFLSSQIYVSKYFCRIKASKLLLKPAIASAVMCGAVYFIAAPTFIRIFAGAALYFISILALKYLDRQDILFLKKIVPGKGIQRLVPYE